MGTEVAHPLRGIIVPDVGFTHSALSAGTGQGGARAGSSVPDTQPTELLMVATGTQTADIDVDVLSTGYPSTVAGPGVRVKLSTEVADAYRTWSPPAAPTMTSYLEIHKGIAETADIATPGGCKMPWLDTFCQAHDGNFYRYDFSGNTWDKVVVTSVVADMIACDVTAIGTRLIYAAAYIIGTTRSMRMWYSDDDGATWADYVVSAPFDVEPTSGTTLLQMHWHPQTRSMLLMYGTQQYASSTVGISWRQIEGAAFTGPVQLAPDGGIWGLEEATNLYAHRVGTPFESIKASTSIQVRSGVASSRWGLWIDDDGVIYAQYDNHTTGVGAQNDALLLASYDSGQTWTEVCAYGLTDIQAAFTATLNPYSAIMCRGTLFMAGVMLDNSDSESALMCLCWGGWANLQTPTAGHAAWRGASGTWHAPLEFDGNVTPGAGSWTGDAYISTVSASVEFWPNSGFGFPVGRQAYGASTQESVSFYLDYEVVSGGDLTKTVRGIEFYATDGVDYYHIEVNCSGTGYRVVDNHAAATVGSDQTLSTARIQLWVTLDVATGAVKTYHRELGSLSTEWEEGVDDTATTATGTTEGWAVGCTETGTVTTVYYTHAAYIDDAPVFDTSIALGKRLSQAPYPLTTEAGTYLHAVAGPGLIGESFSVPVTYDYGTQNLFATDSPSHSREWRSTDSDDTTITIDFARRHLIGRAPAVCFRRSNITDARLEGRNGATGTWTEVGAYSPAITYTYALTTNGETLIPSGTTTGNRYIRENELAGAWVDLGSSRRIIRSNTAGSLNGAADRKCLIVLEDATGTESASGTAVIYPHAGCLVVRDATLYEFREWRIRIPADSTVEGYWYCGALLVGSFVPIGLQPSHGWSHQRAANVRSSTGSRGVAYREQAGPNQTIWTWSYQDPSDEMVLVANADDPTWISSGVVDDFLATYHDVSTLLFGIFDRLEGGALPCVVVAADVSETTTYTDPESFLYAHLTMGSIQANNIQGDELDDAVYRVESLTAAEVVG